MKLKQVMLFVKDLHSVETFYTDLVGFHPIESTRSAGWVEFVEGLSLHAIPDEYASEIVIASPPEVREETPWKPIFIADELEAICAKLEAAGVCLKRYRWGAADCVDPEGNVLQIRSS